MAINKRSVGTMWEQAAIQYLTQFNYEIIQTNFRCKIGEIDIIAKHEGYLVFIEVKYRKTVIMGEPFEAINPKKQHTIKQTAAYYLLSHGLSENTPCRFDAVGILGNNITLIKDAF